MLSTEETRFDEACVLVADLPKKNLLLALQLLQKINGQVILISTTP
jgi:hypothetical protein